MVRTPGSHAPNIKNRSSKHLIKLTKLKPVVRSWSHDQLVKASDDPDAAKELARRARKAEKKNSK